MTTIDNEETTPNLFTSIISKKQFKIKGRLFEYKELIIKSNEKQTLVCKCLDVDENLEYVIKIVKLDDLLGVSEVSETTLDKNSISDTYVGRHQIGEWKFSETIDKLYSSVVVIYEISEIIGDELILVSEYRGIDLETYGNNKQGTLHLYEVLQIFTDVVNALLLIQKRNIIHRDIKPSNIFINYKPHNTIYCYETPNNSIDLITAALGDFGIATTQKEYHLHTYSNVIVLPKNETTSSILCGSPGFIAPECENGIYSVKSDIYSLARTMIWLLFVRNNSNNLFSNTINNLNEFEKKIKEEDLNNNDIILKFIENGNLENDIKGWREFISILKDMLIERISPNQILKRIFDCETIDRPINLKQQFYLISDSFYSNRSMQLFYERYEETLESTLHATQLLSGTTFIKKDREIVLEAVKEDGRVLEYVDESFKKDREIILEAVKQDGNLLYYADDELKKDREIVLEAVKQYGNALKYADDELKNDREFLKLIETLR